MGGGFGLSGVRVSDVLVEAVQPCSGGHFAEVDGSRC